MLIIFAILRRERSSMIRTRIATSHCRRNYPHTPSTYSEYMVLRTITASYCRRKLPRYAIASYLVFFIDLCKFGVHQYCFVLTIFVYAYDENCNMSLSTKLLTYSEYIIRVNGTPNNKNKLLSTKSTQIRDCFIFTILH